MKFFEPYREWSDFSKCFLTLIVGALLLCGFVGLYVQQTPPPAVNYVMDGHMQSTKFSFRPAEEKTYDYVIGGYSFRGIHQDYVSTGHDGLRHLGSYIFVQPSLRHAYAFIHFHSNETNRLKSVEKSLRDAGIDYVVEDGTIQKKSEVVPNRPTWVICEEVVKIVGGTDVTLVFNVRDDKEKARQAVTVFEKLGLKHSL